jgi:hypothetical protein
MSYQPRGRSVAILDRAWEIVAELPYAVTIRFVFYILLQEGLYKKKGDYSSFTGLLSRVRHDFYKGWRPDTFVDDQRSYIDRGNGYESVADWLNSIPARFPCDLSKYHDERQQYYVELWFEAKGMARQFAYYTKHITLRPMGGQPSIPYKWQAAKELDWAAERYGKPLVVLYFGDLDEGGDHISNAIERDVGEWCEYDFQFIRSGLNMAQVKQYGIPENFDKPGEYQWVALPDHGAKDIIQAAVKPLMGLDHITELEATEADATERLRDGLKQMGGRWSNGA